MNAVKEYRDQSYVPTEWEDEVTDSTTGDVMVEGTPVAETTLGNIETGILISHLDIGLLALFASQQANLNRLELEKYQKQRILQGTSTITSAKTNGYFRTAEPFVQVGLNGFPQINAPNYDVLLSITSGDIGLAGTLEAYDKTQNGFKVRMSGSAPSVTFTWTLLNPNV